MMLQVVFAAGAFALILFGVYRRRDNGWSLVVAGGLMVIPPLRALAEGFGYGIPPGFYIATAVTAAIGVIAHLVMSSPRKPPEIWLLVASAGVTIVYLAVSPTSRSVEVATATVLVAICCVFGVVALKRSLPIHRIRQPKG